MIVKCQASLFPDAKRMLFYNSTQEWMGEFDITPEWRELFAEHGSKFFALVRWGAVEKVPQFLSTTHGRNW